MSKAGYRYIEHVSDAIIESYGRTLSEAFSNSAVALINVICEVSRIDLHKCIIIRATGFDQKSLLYNWLEKILLTLLVDNIILAKFDVTIERRKNKHTIFSTCMGEVFVAKKHHYRVEVKGITYHGMNISRRNGEFSVQFLVDL